MSQLPEYGIVTALQMDCDALAKELAKSKANEAKLRAFLADSTEDECEYGDGCPMFVSRHGTCWTCEVKRFLEGLSHELRV